MIKLSNTITEINKVLFKKSDYLFTRYIGVDSPDDVDLLVRSKDFSNVIKKLEESGWKSSSHDHALGGRKKGYQMNLVKNGFIKIDLHKDFTWRKTNYLDTNILWENKVLRKFDKEEINVPKQPFDSFLVMVNILFEKTYFEKCDWKYLKLHLNKVFENDLCNRQAKFYNWNITYSYFKQWYKSKKYTNHVVFLPVWLVLFSYLEKLFKERSLDLTSLLYYVFFRSRYFFNKTLPYS